MQRGIVAAKSEDKAVSNDPISIVRAYYGIQCAEKELEAEKKALQLKLNMIIPAEDDAREFTLPELPGLALVARRVEQDRRKPDDDKLVALLDAKHAPAHAYERKPNGDYVASMIDTGEITKDEFALTLSGKIVRYVGLTPRKVK